MKKRQRIVFEVDSELVRLIVVLRKFYGVSTNNKILPSLIMLSIIDTANLPENPNWTDQQKTAWQKCKEAAIELQQAIVLQSAKKVLSRKPPDEKMSLAELSTEAISELLPREQLAELARQKGIDPTGLRKSGLIRKIQNAKR